MLSQFTWLQFFLFVGGAAVLWYVYVIFVYFGNSINRAITQPREEALAVPVARRPVNRSIIQTEDFTVVAPAQTDAAQEAQTPPNSQGTEGEVSNDTKAPLVIIPPSVLEDAPPVLTTSQTGVNAGEPASEISIIKESIIPTSADSDMSPAVLAALSGQSYNWADSPALNMDYREPDQQGVEEIVALDVIEPGSEDQNGEESSTVPAEDYATTIAQLVQPQIQPEAKETVLSALQNVTGSAALTDLVQRSTNAAGNVTRAFAELRERGLLSEAQVEFSERFLKAESNGITPTPPDGENGDNTTTATPATKPITTIDGEDYKALLDSLT